MKTILLLSALLNVNLISAAELAAIETQANLAVEAPIVIESPDLQTTMSRMGAQHRILATSLVRGEPRPTSQLVAAVRLMKALASHSRGQVPAGTDAARFQVGIDRALTVMAALEVKLVAGDLAAATTVFKEQLLPSIQAGHREFKR